MSYRLGPVSREGGGSHVGWIRRVGGDGRVKHKIGWTPVCSGTSEPECRARLERERLCGAPWRGFALCEWTVLLRGERPTVALRRRVAKPITLSH